MDCEKADSLLLDELYGELDEVTSAAFKKHLAGCATCSAAFEKLSATRKLVAHDMVPVPSDLEDRIMAKVEAKEPPATTSNVASIGGSNVVRLEPRFSRVVSAMGRWAMRPQTAMAAVFLLMIGSSALLLKGRVKRSPEAVTVTEQGAPVAAVAPSAEGRFDDAPDPAAHGLGGARLRDTTLTPPQTVAPSTPQQQGAGGLAFVAPGEYKPAPETERDGLAQRGPANAAAPAGAAAAPADQANREESSDDRAGKNGAPPPPAKAATRSMSADLDEAQKDNKEKKGDGESGFDAALGAYRARSFDDAVRRFDALAKGGDTQAALYAARSVRDGHGCASALTRFDQLASTSFNSPAGYDAALEGGICYRNLGHLEAASSRFSRLLMVPSHAARAQAELDTVRRIAERRSDEAKARKAEASGGAAPAAPAARPTPKSAEPSPAASSSNR